MEHPSPTHALCRALHGWTAFALSPGLVGPHGRPATVDVGMNTGRV